MSSVVKSFWFWLLIIGILLILTAVLIAGGMKEMHGVTWGVFVVGCVLALLGIIFGFIAWSKYKPCEESCLNNVEVCDSPSPSPIYKYTSPINSSGSNIGTPTMVSMNLPQAKRGFSATSLELNSLAPNSK